MGDGRGLKETRRWSSNIWVAELNSKATQPCLLLTEQLFRGVNLRSRPSLVKAFSFRFSQFPLNPMLFKTIQFWGWANRRKFSHHPTHGSKDRFYVLLWVFCHFNSHMNKNSQTDMSVLPLLPPTSLVIETYKVIYFRFWGRRLYNCKKSSSITCTVTESFKREIQFSLHHMVMSQLASFNLYQFLAVFQTGWNWSTTRYGSPSYCRPAGETP